MCVRVCSSKDTAELFFEDVRLPADALLGEPNKGFHYLMKELPQVNEQEERRGGGHALNVHVCLCCRSV